MRAGRQGSHSCHHHGSPPPQPTPHTTRRHPVLRHRSLPCLKWAPSSSSLWPVSGSLGLWRFSMQQQVCVLTCTARQRARCNVWVTGGQQPRCAGHPRSPTAVAKQGPNIQIFSHTTHIKRGCTSSGRQPCRWIYVDTSASQHASSSSSTGRAHTHMLRNCRPYGPCAPCTRHAQKLWAAGRGRTQQTTLFPIMQLHCCTAGDVATSSSLSLHIARVCAIGRRTALERRVSRGSPSRPPFI